jgi:hypothetical protein
MSRLGYPLCLKTETTSLCDALITSLPAGAPCPPVPVGGFDELAELVRYPEMFVKAGIEGTLWIELEALPDSSGRIVKATGPGSEFPKLFGPIFDAIESLKWLRCSIRGTGDTGEQDPVPFPINLQLQAADTHIDTAVTLPGGGVRLMASRILIRDPGSGYAGGPHP